MNEQIFRILNNLANQNSFFDFIITFIASGFGRIMVAGLIVFLVYVFIKKWKERLSLNIVQTIRESKSVRIILLAFISGIIAWIISRIIKYFYPQPRPFLALENVNKLFDHGGNDSFPSGHATFYSALSVVVYCWRKPIGLIYIIGTILIGLTRIIAGVHFPIDILTGYLIGGLVGYLMFYLYK